MQSLQNPQKISAPVHLGLFPEMQTADLPRPPLLVLSPRAPPSGQEINQLFPRDEEVVPLGQEDEVVVPVEDGAGIVPDEVLEPLEVVQSRYVVELLLDVCDLGLHHVHGDGEVAEIAGPI